MLTERYANEQLGMYLHSRDDYKPFPTIEDREMWGRIPKRLQEYWISKGERRLNHKWSTITATEYMDYSRTGNRTRYDTVLWERRNDLASLVIAECIENKGRFVDDIINGIWCICEETFWGIPGNAYMMRRQDPLPDVADEIIELFSAETGALLAWTSYLLKVRLDEVSIMVCERIEREVNRRILNPYLDRTDFWWMGFHQEKMLNNWNPWCNSNCIAAFLLLEEDPLRRVTAISKAMHSLDQYMDRLHSDGGCEEGPNYWIFAGGALFDCLELLYGATDGKIDVYQEPLIRQIGAFIYKAFIHDTYYANFADSPSRVQLPAELMYRYGRRIQDSRLSKLGAMVQKQRAEDAADLPFSPLFRVLPALFHYTEIEQFTGNSPYIRDVWLDGIQFMAAREQEGSPRGLYVAAKGGHNDESHNHNDVGHYIVYCNGSPMIIDPGVMTYTSKSFFSDRYTLWAMQSAYHNLPVVDGVQQQAGRTFEAADVTYYTDDRSASLSMNIAGAYPGTAAIRRWDRTIQLFRDSNPRIVIKDDFQLQRLSTDVTLTLMTPHCPTMEEGGSILLQDELGRGLKIEYNREELDYSIDTIELEDESMIESWGNFLYRIRLQSSVATSGAEWTITITEI